MKTYRFENKVGPDTRPDWILSAVESKLITFVYNKESFPLLIVKTKDGDKTANLGDLVILALFLEVLQIPNYRRLTRRTCSKLKKRYLERGIELHDIHSKNVGILGGKLVMIDFDPFSFIVKNKQKEMYPESN